MTLMGLLDVSLITAPWVSRAGVCRFGHSDLWFFFCESFDVNMRYYILGEYSTCQSHIYAEDFWRYMCLYPTLPLATYTYTSIQLAVLSQIFPLSYTCASESGNN